VTGVERDIDIRPVVSARDLARFVDYPYARHRADPHWIPPLRISERNRLTPSRNPFFAHADLALFLAWRGGQIAGRIAAIDDRLHQATHRDNVAMFGFFEADEASTARHLLEAAEHWAEARGRTALRGPISPSLHESAGVLIDGFDTDPMLLMPHNPPEYARFIEEAGYVKAKDLYAWRYEVDRGLTPTIARLAARVRARGGLIVRALRLNELEREIERLRLIYCGAWERNWGFVPPTAEEFRRLAAELRPIFDPRAAVCVEAEGGPVACAVAVPDINQALRGTGGRLFPVGLIRLLARRWIVDQARLLLLGVLPEYRHLGLYPLLLSQLHQQIAGVYRHLEFSWVLEDNLDINQPAELAGARRYKTYRIYEKGL
jgi:hypothetical protein